MVTRVYTPFTEGHYYGKGEKPNTELADNSAFTHRSNSSLIFLFSHRINTITPWKDSHEWKWMLKNILSVSGPTNNNCQERGPS